MKKKIFLVLVVILGMFLLTACDLHDDGSIQYDIYKLAKEEGYTGTYEEWLATVKGADGKDGREIEVSIEENKIVWRYVGETEWKPIYSVDDLIGPKGEDGVSITKIEKTKTEGVIDTYTITYSNGKTSEFTVTNGSQGIQGIKGEDGHSPVITISDKLTWVIDGVDSNIKVYGKSAYEMYIEKHPEYKGNEDQWLDDLVNGRLGTEEETYYTVKFNSNGGTSIEDQKILKYEKVKKPETPVKTGYSFEGWYIDDEKWVFSGYPVTCDITLTAKWKLIQLSVEIDLDNGTEISNKIVNYNEIINLDTPSKKDNLFVKWVDQDNNELKMPLTIQKDTKIKAVWKDHIIFSYDSDGGNTIPDQEIKLNENINKLPVPTKKNFVFLGWFYKNGDVETKLTLPFTNKFTENIHLTAHWNEVSGDYQIENLSDGTLKIVGYNGHDKELIIPDKLNDKKVTIIGNDVFRGKNFITKVTINENITKIGDNAFADNPNLKEFEIYSLTKYSTFIIFGKSILRGCINLETLNIDYHYNIIELFGSEEIHIPKTLETIIYSGYYGNITNSFKGIEKRTFTIDFRSPSSDFSFYNFNQMRKLILHDQHSNNRMGNPFFDCHNLEEIVFPDSLKKIDGDLIYGANNISKFNIPSSLETLDLDFINKTNIEIFLIPNTIKNIIYNNKYRSLSFMPIFQGTEEEWKTNYKSEITFPVIIDQNINTLNFVNDGIFKYCETNTNHIFLIEYILKESESVDLVKLYPNKNIYSIGAYCFSECNFLKNVVLTDTIQILGIGAFYKCSNLTTINIPTNLKYLMESCFAECSNLNNIILPETLDFIDDSVFDSCTNLSNITIPNSVTKIGNYAFNECKNLKNISLPENLVTIGYGVFQQSGINSIVIPNSVTSLGAGCFNYCFNLKTMVLPSSIDFNFGAYFPKNEYLVLFAGTEEEFNKKNMHGFDNYCTYTFESNAKVFFNVDVSNLQYISNDKYSYYLTNNGEIYDLYFNKKLEIFDPEIEFPNKKVISYKLEQDYHYSISPNIMILSNSLNPLSELKFGSLTLFRGTEEELKKYTSSPFVYCIGNSSFELINNSNFKAYKDNLNNVYIVELLNKNLNYIDFTKEFPNLKVKFILQDCFKFKSFDAINIDSLEHLFSINFGNEYSCLFGKTTNLYVNNVLVTDLVIPEGITKINSHLFGHSLETFNSITLPNTIKEVSTNSLGNVSHYAGTIEGNCKYLGSNANPYLILVERIDKTDTELKMNNLCELVYDNVFTFAANLNKLYLSEKLHHISKVGFHVGNNKDISIYISNTKLWIDLDKDFIHNQDNHTYYDLYVDNQLLTNLTITADTPIIEEYEFAFCKSLVSVDVKEGVKRISDYAFYGCTNLANCTIPNTLEYIDGSSFLSCDKLKYNEIYGCNYLGNSTNPYLVFFGFIGQKTVKLHDDCYYITDFRPTYNVDEIFINKNIKYINSNAFESYVYTLLCEVTKKPTTWANDWAGYNVKVKWAYTVPTK